MNTDKKKRKSTPKTPQEWAITRFRLNLEIAQDALNGKSPFPVSNRQEYALFCVIKALSELPEIIRVHPCPSVVKK